MTDPELSGVDPVRHAEVRRRIRLVVEYLNGPRTASRRKHAAAELGVTPGQFLRIARSWRETGSAARLQGAGASPRPRQPTRALDTAVEDETHAAIAELGAEARITDVFADVVRRCHATGLTPPSQSTVYDRLNRHRRAAGKRAAQAPSIALVRCSLRFPITHQGATARPAAMLAVIMPEGVVAAAEIGVDGGRQPDLARLMRRLARLSSPGAPPRPVVAHAALIAAATDAVVEGVPLGQAPGVTSIVSRVFGQRLGPIPITTAAHSDRAFRKRAAGRLNNPPTLVEATSLLLRAIETHNAARGHPRPPAFSVQPSTFDHLTPRAA